MNNETNPTEAANVEQADLKKLARETALMLPPNILQHPLPFPDTVAIAADKILTALQQVATSNKAEIERLKAHKEIAQRYLREADDEIKGLKSQLTAANQKIEELTKERDELVRILTAIKAHGVTHAVGCSHRPETCSCHKSLMEKALKVSTDGDEGDEPAKSVLENINFAMRYLTDREFAGARFPDIDTAVQHLQSAVRKLTKKATL